MPSFAIVKKSVRELDQSLLKIIITNAKKIAWLLIKFLLKARSIFVLSAKTLSRLHLLDIKMQSFF